jgi:hypothetical protein
MDWKVREYNLCAAPIALLNVGAVAADNIANAMTIAQLSVQEHIVYHLRAMPTNDEWKVFLELIMNKNAKMTATPNEIITKLVGNDAAIKRENGLAPEALLFAKKGSRSCRDGKVSRSPMRDKRDNERDNQDDRKGKDFSMCFHYQW